MKVVIASDHAGLELKNELKGYVTELGHQCEDYGTYTADPVDYPDLACLVAVAVSSGRCDLGIVVDGAGVGSCMAANKVAGVRAASCQDTFTARNSREHNNANVLTLGSRVVGSGLAREIVKTFLQTEFAGGRHARRVNKISDIESRFLPGQARGQSQAGQS